MARGRRPGPGTTSEDILAAARRLFAERGYRATTVRAIASEAGVTPAMINHFYGGKRQVFVAAIRMPFDPAALLASLLDGPRAEFPDRFVRAFVTAWSDPTTGPALRTMLRSAMTDDEQGAALRAFAGGVMLPRVTAALGVPADRAATAMSIMIGCAVARSLIGIEALATLDDEDVIARYAPAVRTSLGL